MLSVLLDLDGVLVNFDKGCQKIFNWPRTPRKPLQNIREFLGVSNKEFWDTIDSYGEEFWSNLEPEPWAYELINIVKFYDRNFTILTSPSRSHYAASGKVLWLQKFFKSRKFSNYIITPAKNKCLLAHKKAVLIDDNDKNCQDFLEKLGYVILFPRISNEYYSLEERKLEHTKQQLDLISKYA